MSSKVTFILSLKNLSVIHCSTHWSLQGIKNAKFLNDNKSKYIIMNGQPFNSNIDGIIKQYLNLKVINKST
jgi:hypothetical protein